jgi:hypothetical protein
MKPHTKPWAFLFVLVALLSPAQAADVVFPAGSRVGLAPPPGMSPSHNFQGFEDAAHSVAVVIAALPREAHWDLRRSTSAEELKKRGITLETREEQKLDAGDASLVIARQEVDKLKLRKWIFSVLTPDLIALVTVQVPDEAATFYPESAIRTALSTVTIRATVPVEEQLGLLPFRVSELAQFRIGGVIPGRAIMLTDAATDNPGPDVDTHIVVAVAPGGPAQAADRDTFARDVFGSIPNLKDVHVNSAEPLRIGGQPGHQVMATGKDARTGADVKIVQWLRFGGGAYLHLIGIARTNAWIPAYARFRQVRDGIELQ